MCMVKKLLKILFNVVFVVLVFYFILHDHYYEIVDSLQQLHLMDILFLAVLGLLFFALDTLAHKQVIEPYVHSHQWKTSFELVSLNHFFNATTSSVGTIPFQSYYLKKKQIPYSQGISAMFLNMIFHKIAVCVNALLVFTFAFSWLMENPSMQGYVWLGFGLNLIIIIILIVFIFWKRTEWIFQKLSRFFKSEESKKEMQQLAFFAKEQLKNKKMTIKALLAHQIKVMWLCAIPYFCLFVLHETSLGFFKVYALSSLAYIIASSLPNVAGIGPLEYAYIVLFTFYLPGPLVSTSLLLYRIFSFYFLVIISTFVFLRLRLVLTKM